jgi:hypothetical protein
MGIESEKGARKRVKTHIPHPKLFQREITEMKNQS